MSKPGSFIREKDGGIHPNLKDPAMKKRARAAATAKKEKGAHSDGNETKK